MCLWARVVDVFNFLYVPFFTASPDLSEGEEIFCLPIGRLT